MKRGLLALSLLIASACSTEQRQEVRAYVPPPPPRPGDGLVITKWDWSRGGFGSVMLASFSIQNLNDYAVKDIRVECDVKGNSGTTIDIARATIYEILPSKKTRRFPEVNLGFIQSQGKQASCRVAEATRA